MDTKDIGNLGEHLAIIELLKHECIVSRPLGDSAEYDLIVDFHGKLKTCQVKTKHTNYKNRLIFNLSTASKRAGSRDKYYTVDCFILVDLLTNKVAIINNPIGVKTITLQYDRPKYGAKSNVKLIDDYSIKDYINSL